LPGRIEAGKVAVGLGIFRPPHSVAIYHDGRTATRLPGGTPLLVGLLLLRRQRRRGRNDVVAIDAEAGGLAGLGWAPAAAAAAFALAAAAAAASAARPWSIENDICGAAAAEGAGAGAGLCCADADETLAAANRTTAAMIRIFTSLQAER